MVREHYLRDDIWCAAGCSCFSIRQLCALFLPSRRRCHGRAPDAQRPWHPAASCRPPVPCRSGSPLDAECPQEAHKLSGSAATYLLIDSNVALHQLDLLEHQAVEDVIVCSTVLDEVRHKNQAAYQRLRALCANPSRRQGTAMTAPRCCCCGSSPAATMRLQLHTHRQPSIHAAPIPDSPIQPV